MQLAGQVLFLERMMDEQIRAIGSRNVLEIRYETLCARPGSVLEQVATLLRENGADLPAVRQDVPPFEARHPGTAADPSMTAALRDAFAFLESR
jgi:hypothetical protein